MMVAERGIHRGLVSSDQREQLQGWYAIRVTSLDDATGEFATMDETVSSITAQAQCTSRQEERDDGGQSRAEGVLTS